MLVQAASQTSRGVVVVGGGWTQQQQLVVVEQQQQQLDGGSVDIPRARGTNAVYALGTEHHGGVGSSSDIIADTDIIAGCLSTARG
jgi:hypothetical protein